MSSNASRRITIPTFFLLTSYSLLLIVALAVPMVVFAVCPPGQEAVGTNPDGTDQCAPAAGGGGGSTAGGSGSSTELPNPLGEVTDISQIVGNVLRALFGILGSIALLMFIYGGFTWLTSGGAAEKIQKGKDTMVWAVLGIAIVFAAYTIVNFVIDALVQRS